MPTHATLKQAMKPNLDFTMKTGDTTTEGGEDCMTASPSIHDRLSKYAGAGGVGIVDLATNPKHFERYGRESKLPNHTSLGAGDLSPERT